MYFFDCDGVLLDSNAVKTEGFRAVALSYGPAAAEALAAYHTANGGISRYVKFRYLFSDLLRREPDNGEYEGCLARYAARVRAALRDCPEIPGARAFVTRLRSRESDAPCFVVSGSDEAELREILTLRGWAPLFAGIFGAPATKLDHVRRLIAARGRGAGPRPTLFGDSRSDYEAAAACDCEFVMIHGASEWAGWARHLPTTVRRARDFTELL